MIRTLACITLVFIALMAWSPRSRAAESYDNCTGFVDSVPAVITTQGTWCLRKDLATAMDSGKAIEIAANNVTLDCNDFKVGGLAAGVGTSAIGVRADDRFNVTVRNCRIRGFRVGIELYGAGHLVEDNTVEGGRSYGVSVLSAGSVVRGNRVVDSGGSTAGFKAVEAGIQVNGGVDVIDNRVSGVRPTAGSAATAAGILAVNNGGGTIIGNRVSGLAPGQGRKGVGILSLGLGRAATSVVSGNILTGSGSASIADTAIQCDGLAAVLSNGADAISVDNVLLGFDTAIEGCSPGSNSVNSH